ncbi:MAG TPA: glucosaminidase domain-containing protein, partial [Chloroflexia bacterium]|nr:glucosaminidase domain-containing protein [Chloroflexia bacterium]
VLAADPPSPIAGEADAYFDLCVQYGINPAVALAFFSKESDRGTTGVAVQTRSWGNQRRARQAARSTGTLQTQWGPFAIYRNWRDSLADWCETLLSEVYKGEGRTTVRSVIPKYAPAFENNTTLYIHQTLERLSRWQDAPPPAPGFIDYPILAPPAISQAQFVAILQQYGSPAGADAPALYDLAVANKVDPAVALAFFVMTSRAGTGYQNPAKVANHNWGEIAGNGAGIGGVATYSTWAQGLTAWIRLLVDDYGSQGLNTLSTVLGRYQPAGMSDPASYARALGDLIQIWQNAPAGVGGGGIQYTNPLHC